MSAPRSRNSMLKLHPFYKYYDLLFASKDYRRETTAVFQIYQRYQKTPLRHILEIGCGTGNHTTELARKKGVSVTAIDYDRHMISLAKKKFQTHGLKNIELSLARVERMPEKNFNLIVALFNVVTYLEDGKSLRSFFKAAASHLDSQGIFIFDCWNGLAARIDPPRNKTYQCRRGKTQIVCELTSKTNFRRQQTRLSYHLDIFAGNKKIESGAFSFHQTLWTPNQIQSALQKAGLKILRICVPFQFHRTATKKDWKIMFICKK